MKCPTCGTENEAANRFCEQCGSRLESSGGFQQVQIDMAAAQTAPGPTCPSCGATVLPGEAFCDECGAALNTSAPAHPSAFEAPTLIAPAQSAHDGAAAPRVTCPSCGHQNLPGDHFCDNCGAELPAAGAASGRPAGAQAPKSAAEPAPLQPLRAASGAPALQVPLSEAPTAEQPMVGARPGAAQQAYEAEVKRLEDEIDRQDKIIAQFEHMQQMFGTATPAAVTQGLADARDTRARAVSELDALKGGASAPAPATAAGGAPTEAQAKEAQAEVQLGQLGTVPAPTAIVTSEPEPAPPVAAPPPIVAPQPAAPRLVFDDGKELKLPSDKREIVVGREDPISGIFPEVDLTPYGGETGGVSRQHAKLHRADGSWTLTDLHSTNYTRVDGAKIEPSVAVPIRSGTRIQFGRVAMTFQE